MPEELPEPLVPPEVDLRDFAFTPIFRGRLFGSSFHARASDAAWRAGVTLWLKSWDQVPAGTLPDDEIDLCRLAELGRDVKEWRKVEKEALWGWYKCSDGRLHHKTVAEGVTEAWERKKSQRDRTAAARAKKLSQRLLQGGGGGQSPPVTGPATRSVTEPETEPVTGSKGQGERQGQAIPTLSTSQNPATACQQISANELHRRLMRAANDHVVRGAGAEIVTPILTLMASGCDLERHILPTIERIVPSLKKPLGSWSAPFLTEEILALKASDAGRATPSPDEPRIDFPGGVSWPRSTVLASVRRWRDDPRSWPAILGFPPDDASCRVPADILAVVVDHTESVAPA